MSRKRTLYVSELVHRHNNDYLEFYVRKRKDSQYEKLENCYPFVMDKQVLWWKIDVTRTRILVVIDD